MRVFIIFAAASLLFSTVPTAAQTPPADPPAAVAVEQLRHSIGLWNVTTQFINPQSGETLSVEGQYRFGWVVPDRVVQGMSTIPSWNQASAILFFLRPSTDEIEMLSVGGDGMVWRMTGPETSETRTTENRTMADGSTVMLRFTRYDVTPNSFRSRMETSNDGGQTWTLGNRQHFRRTTETGSRS